MRFDVQSVLMKSDDVTRFMNDCLTLLLLVSTLPDLWADPNPSSQRMREQSCVSDASDEAVVPLDRDETGQVRNVIATACEFNPVIDLSQVCVVLGSHHRTLAWTTRRCERVAENSSFSETYSHRTEMQVPFLKWTFTVLSLSVIGFRR